MFDYNPHAVPIDAYVDERASSLSLDDRMELIRRIGEALSFAHERRLEHRGLTPKQVYVANRHGKPEVRIRDWHTGRRTAATSTSIGTLARGASDPRDLVEQAGWLYLPPEAHAARDTDDEDVPSLPLDVYGFGALAYLILTGKPPATGLSDLQQRL